MNITGTCYKVCRASLFAGIIAVLSLVAAGATGAETPAPRERISLDSGWRFHHGDIPFPVISGHSASYNHAKAGSAGGAATAKKFNDSDWRLVDLPHDWAIELPVSRTNNLAQGFRTRGIGWYRRSFTLKPEDAGRNIELQFDGVATFCTVWVNGIVSHRNWCGYTSFTIDITPFARYGNETNIVAVRVDADALEGWWYEGAGIYRHTWLVKRNPVHIATDGVFANPVRRPDGGWHIPIEVTLGNSGAAPAVVEVESVLIDPAGEKVGSGKVEQSVAPFDAPVAKFTIKVTEPSLWSIEKPVLYEVRTVMRSGGAALDGVTTRCGFRSIRFDPDKGFFLNDKPVKLKGTCNHQDHGGVGVAVPDSLWDFRIRRLKEMGSNAYRCAHNAPAAEFLDACDRLGLLVMDENRNFNTTAEYQRQLEWLVRRDRNHPCVILWSVFNEEPMQGSRQGYEMVRMMSAVVKKLDGTRPVTAAQNEAMMNEWNASKAAEVAGFNYQPNSYDLYHKAYPSRPMTSSEDTSAVMTRGEYTTDRSRSILDSYDTQYQPWGLKHREAWKRVAERPFVAGGFVWTGFDYHGEPQPLDWPATASSFGCMDLCGFPKTAYYIHQAQWIDDRAILQLVPHWNWPGREGKPVKVMALTNARKVRLSLNGKLVAEKPVDKYEMVSWEVPYEAGKLEAVGFNDDREVSRCVVETAGEPVALQLVADRPGLAGDGRDAQPVTVQVIDAQGRSVPTAGNLVSFEVTGPGAIIGVGNGNPLCHEMEKLPVRTGDLNAATGWKRSLYNGLAQVILQSVPDSPGMLQLKATADGLKPAEISVKVEAIGR